MSWLERTAFLVVFVTMGKLLERLIGLGPAIGVSLAVVLVPAVVYALIFRRRT